MSTTICELIDIAFLRFPDRVALVDTDESLTFAELEALGRGAVAFLRQLGVGPNDVVGVLGTRSIDTVVALIAILKVGATYLPLDASYPTARLQYMLQDAKARVVLFDVDLPALASASSVNFVPLRALRAAPLLDWNNAHYSISAHDLAYICYTSGTTGNAKGVMVTHANFSSFALSFLDQIKMESTAVVLARTPISFDPHFVELILPLCVGAKIVLFPENYSGSIEALIDALDRHAINFLQATPSLLSALLRGNWTPRYAIDIFSGGEPLTDTLKNCLLGLSGVRLWNLYGPTETTVWCSALEVYSQSPVRIGPPISGTRFSVRDERGTLMGPGQVGELYISGTGVSAGYLGQEDLTARSFVADGDGTAWISYRTGDLVKQLDDFGYAYLGRVDTQIKLRGYRIELAEIEVCILNSDLVADVAVIVGPQDALIAYIVPGAGTAGDGLADRIVEWVRALLPGYMVPAVVLSVDRLPLSPTLKVDRILLASPPFVERAMQGAPTNEPAPFSAEMTEHHCKAIEKIWCEVLQLPNIDRHARFTALGGHSLNVGVVRHRLIERFGIALSPVALNQADTIARQAVLVNQCEKASPVVVTQSTCGRQGLSPAQARFLTDTAKDKRNANILEFCVRTSKPQQQVVEAIEILMARHDVFDLRTISLDGNAWQGSGFNFMARQIDVRTSDSVEEVLVHAENCRAKIDVDRGIFYQWLVTDEKTGCHVYLAASHLICDALSLDVLKFELDMILSGRPELLSTPASFMDWICRSGSAENMESFRQELPHWSAIVQRKNTQSSTDAARVGSSWTLQFSVRRPLSLATLNHRHILAALAHAYGVAFRCKSIPCRIVDSGRGLHDELDDSLTVGWIAQHIPLRIDVGGGVASTYEQIIQFDKKLAHRGCGYGWLRYTDRHPALVSGCQLKEFPLYFNYLPVNRHRFGAISDRSERLNSSQPRQGQAISGVAVLVQDDLAQTKYEVIFDGEHINASSIDTLVDHFLLNLAATDCVNQIDSKPLDLPVAVKPLPA